MKITFLPLLFLLLLACDIPSKNKSQNQAPVSNLGNEPIGLVIHGGAGTIKKENMTADKEQAYRAVLEQAVKAGYNILNEGGSSLNAVEEAIVILENSPLFNAGKGAVFTNSKENELDASIMDGATLNAGAVAGVKKVKNPIRLARTVMEKSEHVMFAGEGADIFAKEQGLELVDSAYFYTKHRMQSLIKAQAKERVELDHSGAWVTDPLVHDSKYGTVGCVALDKNGNLAAGTSTGGMTNKRWGRVGDSPIIGAGTYANNNSCAVSSTGWGEYFIRAVVAYDVSAAMFYKNSTLEEAAKLVIQEKLTALGGSGGIIAIDKNGNTTAEFNTEGMYRAWVNSDGEITVAIYGDE